MCFVLAEVQKYRSTEGYGVNFGARKIKHEVRLHKNSFSENIVHAFLSEL